jgi:hypothetical protein
MKGTETAFLSECALLRPLPVNPDPEPSEAQSAVAGRCFAHSQPWVRTTFPIVRSDQFHRPETEATGNRPMTSAEAGTEINFTEGQS